MKVPIAKIRRLHVTTVSYTDVKKHWDFNIPFQGQLYARCDSKGKVSWDTTSIYRLEELLLRGNVKILKTE